MTDPNILTANTGGAGTLVAGAPAATTRPHLYIAIVLLAVLGTYGYQIKKDSIFACPATGYAADRYLAYCQADHYGDYEHGAFWFGLEPEVRESLAAAQVMFMGNSRLQWGFSNRTTSDWFASIRASYYLIGFSYYETYKFEASLLRQVSPRARVYVINIDGFFKPEESVPAQSVMHDAGALQGYETKRRWQSAHQAVCARVTALCGNDYAVYRSRSTGTWFPLGGHFEHEATSEEAAVDGAYVQQYVSEARRLLAQIPVKHDCIILTMVPTFKTKRVAAEAIASELGLPLISPRMDGLFTFDGSHLERASAERWSAAFLQAAGSQIRQCIGQTPGVT